MTLYTFFESEEAGLGIYLGTYDDLSIGLKKMKKYFDCIYFEMNDQMVTIDDLQVLLQLNHRIIVNANEGGAFHILKADLNVPPVKWMR